MYPALLQLTCTFRLPVVDWTDAPVDVNGRVRVAERRNVVSARVPSHFKRSIIILYPVGLEMCWLSYQLYVNDAKRILNGRIPENIIQHNKLKAQSSYVVSVQTRSIKFQHNFNTSKKKCLSTISRRPDDVNFITHRRRELVHTHIIGSLTLILRRSRTGTVRF